MDIFANREFRATWNKFLCISYGYEFGKPGETISSALGKNQRDSEYVIVHEFSLYYIMRKIKTFKYSYYSNLTFTGNLLCNILDSLDKEHCKNSINLEI